MAEHHVVPGSVPANADGCATRRKVLGLFAATPIAALPLTAIDAEPAQEGGDDSEYTSGWECGRRDGLDTFAIAWLTRWTTEGGSVTIDLSNPDKISIGHPMHRFSPEQPKQEAFFATVREQEWFRKLSEPDQNRFIKDRRRLDDDLYTGRMRALHDLLASFEAGFAAVKQIVRNYPVAGLRPVFASDATKEA